jgi:hypothetical protein
MYRTLRHSVNISVVGLATVGLVAAGVGAAVSAPQTKHPQAKHPQATPQLRATIGMAGLTVRGPKTFKAGRVGISLKSYGDEHTFEVASLKKGYTFQDARKDVQTFGPLLGSGPNGSTPKSALIVLNRVINNTKFYGGLDALPGQTVRGTVVLPKAGVYIAFDDTNAPAHPVRLVVTGPPAVRAMPKSTATVTALTARRFGGSKVLPAKGTITFKNKSTESPHFLSLLHVKAGTTKKDVLTGLESNGPPSFILPGQVGTDILGKGMSQTLTYSVPKGEYVELCFFPDPKTGMPHAFMGMIGLVTLK